MCLLLLAWMSHPRYRLVVAANRDEFHDRESAPLAWWGEGTPILAGRDLVAGGTWMGVTRTGRFGAVTNYRDLARVPPPDARSRGMLVPDFLNDDTTPAAFLERLGASAAGYAGFNVIAGAPRSLCYYSNRGDSPPRDLEPGIYGLSNHELDSPWPKLIKARERFAAELDGEEPRADALFDVLADRVAADDGALQDTGLPADMERAMSSPFVLHPRYGTRCSTVLMVGHDGHTVASERRFDATGRLCGATRIEFAGAEPR